MDSRDLQELAMKQAEERFDVVVRRLVEAADGDPRVLADAAHVLAKTSKTAGTPEHIAFTYLSAAYRRMTAD